MHESHHRPRDGPFELNDLFAIINGVSAIALLAYEFLNKSFVSGLCFGTCYKTCLGWHICFSMTFSFNVDSQTVATSTLKKLVCWTEGQVPNDQAGPIVDFSKPPTLPPVLGLLAVVSLFETVKSGQQRLLTGDHVIAFSHW
ncbi:hypothetical protein F0562_013197 [Nyssa sinensis]|uniref:beta-carotene 3-hydroxylase n=1 Tax=Nyssa sinensis TaxID=561372 RepID=A0A5J4ZYC4_9ASTE|nr:hypothetical protein F0562_013197 [Nyssa sinensis]